MRDDVQTLLAIQEIDAELIELERQRAEIPLRRASLLHEETVLQAETDATRERLRTLLLEGRERETEMRTQEDRAARYRGQLGTVNTNKEYVSLLSELKGVQEKASAAEDRAIAILGESEQLRGRIAELEQEFQRAREASEGGRRELDAEEQRLTDEIAVRRDRRATMATRVAVGLFRKYESIVRRGRLPALVPLRARACGNCYGTIPLQVASQIRTAEQPYTCEHCGVILYVPETERSEV